MDTLSARVRSFCAQQGLWLQKSLGQHFLIDEEALKSIVAAGNIQPTDTVVEIGAGIGILTAELLKKAKNVIAVEIDPALPPLMRTYLLLQEADLSKLTLVRENALNVEFPNTKYKIIANIPYHITSPLLRHAFVESKLYPESLTLLIQKEVAEKICDTEDSNMLSVLTQLFGVPRILRTVSKGSFLPPPNVESAVLHIESFQEPRATGTLLDQVFRLTKLGFSQKRKMLRNTVGSLPDGMELLEKAGIDPTRRPQHLSIDEWISLARFSANEKERSSPSS